MLGRPGWEHVLAVVQDTLDLSGSAVASVLSPGEPAADAILHLLAHMANSDGVLHEGELAFLASVLPGRTQDALERWVREMGALTKGVSIASDESDGPEQIGPYYLRGELGGQIGADMAERERVMYEHAFSVLSDDEQAVLDELLERVNVHLRDADLPPPPVASRDWAALFDADATDAGAEARA